jgi:hypothetical protein
MPRSRVEPVPDSVTVDTLRWMTLLCKRKLRFPPSIEFFKLDLDYFLSWLCSKSLLALWVFLVKFLSQRSLVFRYLPTSGYYTILSL